MEQGKNNQRSEYDLESILAEFGGGAAKRRDEPPEESLADRSRRLVLKTMDDAFDAGSADILSGIIDAEAAAARPPAPTPAPKSAQTPAPKPAQASAPARPPAPPPTQEAKSAPGVALRELTDNADKAEYASAKAAEKPPAGLGDAPAKAAAPAPPRTPQPAPADSGAKKGRSPSPLMGLMALLAVQKEQQRNPRPAGAGQAAEAETPEPPPEAAARFYNARMASLRTRGRIAVALSLFLLYLTFAWYASGLPLLGALDGNIKVMGLVLFIFEASVIMTGLDVFTEGILGLFRRRAGAGSLVAVSCVLSLADAAVIAMTGTTDYGLPFCAVSAISMTFAIWGDYYAAKGLRNGFRVLTSSKTLYTVTGERGLAPDDVALLKSRQSVRGFINRSLEADFGEVLYGVLTPFLLIAALIFGLLGSLVPQRSGSIVHCLSILTAATATFSCAVCFALPFAAASRHLGASGAAVAGWSGLRDIGEAKRVVITDADIFPLGTVKIGKVRILEGAFTDKVISGAASVIAASGCGLAGPFADLIRRNGYTVSKVENFEPHDGGGMTAMVEGESIYVGSAGFMNLMGIRLPQKLATRGSVYAAINGALVGIFQIEYTPSKSVQDALVLLLRSKMEPIFAIRDFNITPAMIRDIFQMPTDAFKFPPYAERYRISGATPDRSSRVAAVIARDGMGPLVDVAERGRRAHLGVRAAAWVSAAGSVFGLITMFLLCWTGAFDSASASNVIIFMLLWLIPLIVSILGLER